MVTTTTSPFKDHSHNHHQWYQFVAKKILPWAIYSILPIALFRLCFYPPNFSSSLSNQPITVSTTTPPPSPTTQEIDESTTRSSSCDYTKGKWVQDKQGPIYNGTTCGTIKKGQNCMAHGRPDMGYLYWQWRPNNCGLQRFDPIAFLRLITDKHIAFVGDSMARNQLESLLCMLATSASPRLVYKHGGEEGKFRRWVFEAHNATVSVYWSPFLVHGVEKSPNGPNHNELYLDRVDRNWADDLGRVDYLVMSVGHWFLHPAVYFESGSAIGCHYCPGLNHTEVEFYVALRKAIRTAFGKIRQVVDSGDAKIGVVLTTFSPSHFEGEWDKAGACPKLRPYMEGEKKLEGMDNEIRRIEVEEVELAKRSWGEHFFGHGVEVLDVTKLALMRPDGHPGPYMHPFPFANGVGERVQNDCVHWCLPGPIDTWNEILLQIFERWNSGPVRPTRMR